MKPIHKTSAISFYLINSGFQAFKNRIREELGAISSISLESLIDDDLIAHGATLCVDRALASEGPLPSHLRFDVVSVCVNLDAGRVRVHHVRGAWQS